MKTRFNSNPGKLSPAGIYFAVRAILDLGSFALNLSKISRRNPKIQFFAPKNNMRLEFEPNSSAACFVENEVVSQDVSSEVERMLREGVRAAQEGKRVEARGLLLRVTEADAESENAWLWLASISEYPEELLV